MRAKMETFYYNDPVEESPCNVALNGPAIEVSYDEDGIPVVWKGAEHYGQGHYILKCPGRNGTATLHRLKDSAVMAGSWREQGQEGMWKITLT